ncbi:hypothetical protein BS78_02G147300 [Paspalum vaginatum]|nr:hypothetical protein BS78_02G147300 [Paspalum vaginatum]
MRGNGEGEKERRRRRRFNKATAAPTRRHGVGAFRNARSARRGARVGQRDRGQRWRLGARATGRLTGGTGTGLEGSAAAAAAAAAGAGRGDGRPGSCGGGAPGLRDRCSSTGFPTRRRRPPSPAALAVVYTSAAAGICLLGLSEQQPRL